MVIGNWNEKSLLFKLQTKRDPDAFAALYDTYVERIYRFVFFKVGNQTDTEDIVSETFLKTWNYITSHKSEEVKSFSGLLYRIARNCIVDYYRKKQTVNQPSVGAPEDLGDGVYEGTIPMTAGEYYVPGGGGEEIYDQGGFDI